MNVLDFTMQIQGALPDDLCDDLIDLFEKSEHKQRYDNGGYPNWTNLFLSIHHPEIDSQLSRWMGAVALKYRQETLPYGEHFNLRDYHLEGCNIKKYVGGSNDVYGRHADSSSLETSRRFIAMLFYLNDDFEGGETIFYPKNIVRPKKGSVLVFPPFWLFPHEGRPVTKGTKYIMSNYCLWKK